MLYQLDAYAIGANVDGSFAYRVTFGRVVTVDGFLRKEMQPSRCIVCVELCLRKADLFNLHFDEKTGCALGELQRTLHFIAVHYSLRYSKVVRECVPQKPLKC